MLFLITSTVLSLWSIAQTLRLLVAYSEEEAYLETVGTSYPCEPLSRLHGKALVLTTGRHDESRLTLK